MSKRTEVAVFERTISVPGVRFAKNALTFERVDEGTLVATGAFLQAVDECAAWWWGDFLAEYCGWSLKKDERDAGSKFDALTAVEKLKHYTARYAAIAGKEPKTLSMWKSVSEAFKSSRRREDLTWSHHAEAKFGSGADEAVADNWLDLAEKHRWSVSQLRAAMRKQARSEQEPEEPLPQLVLPMELVQARRYATTAIGRVTDMDEEEAKALFVELTPVMQFWQALGQRLGMATLSSPPVAGTPGPKESLPAAS